VHTVNTLSKKLHSIGSYVLQTFKAAATVTMEQDLKIIIRYMHVVQQLTLTKYANVLMAAQLGKTSPYAISKQELVTYAKQLKTEKGIAIVTAVEETKSSVALIDNQIQILIQVPIVDEQKLFHFYHIKPLPTFMENKTFIPILDAEYIALSRSGAKYVQVTATEFLKCILQPDICKVTNPITPVNENSLCVIKTYQAQKLACPLQETDKVPKPTVVMTANKALYAVPHETPLYVKCTEHTESHTYTDETVTVNGTGEVAFKASCTITLPSGETYNTPSEVHEQQITHSGLFEILKQEPNPTHTIINRIPKTFQTAPEVQLIDVEDTEEPSKPQNPWEEAFDPKQMETFAIRISSIVVTILLLAAIFYCCCPTQTKDLCKLICWLPNFIKKKRTRTYEMKQDDRIKKNDILLQKLAAQMDDITKQQQTDIIKESPIPKRWSSAVQLAYPFSRMTTPTPTPRTTVTTQSDDIDIHMPPPMASPTLSYRPKTLDDTNTSTPQTTPTHKRVQFISTSTS
jgi:hypothetical protein